MALGFISGAWICSHHPLMANHLPSLKQGSSMTRDGRTDTLCWDHAPSTVLGQQDLVQQKPWAGLIQLLPPLPPAPTHSSWNKFFPAQGAKQTQQQSKPISIFPKAHPGPTLALRAGDGAGKFLPE